MTQPITFADVLEAAEQLDDRSPAALVAILSRPLAERGRPRVMDTVEQARQEFAAGQFHEMTGEAIVREALP